MWIHPPDFLREIAKQCKKHNVLLIADEVATGFGKTGSMFAVELAEVLPDIMVLGKGLSAGYLPLSCALTSEEIYSAFLGEPQELKQFFYGQTFAGNPLAASVATANLDLFLEPGFFQGVCERMIYFQKELKTKIHPLPNVEEVRSFGVMTAIELTKTPGQKNPYPIAELIGQKIVWSARKKGIVIRPLGNAMVLMPPLVMKEQDISKLVDTTAESINEVCGQ